MADVQTVTELAASFRSGDGSPTEAMDAVLQRVDELDGDLQAWQVVYADEARRAAAGATEALATGHRSGPFHGIPFALKDIVDVEGRVTTAGSAAHIDRISPATATIARRLTAAGGVMIGKTKTVELALGGWGTNHHMGTPHNPWDGDVHRAPGGSSSGSGVAVASGMAPCAIGTDTGGSVRLPASYCGIVGLKTTEGLLPTDGIVPLSHTLDTPGPMARTVADAALMFDVLTGRNPVDIDHDHQGGLGLYGSLRAGVRGLKFGVLPDNERSAVDPDVLESYDGALTTLAGLGAELEEFEMPRPFDELKDETFVIVTAEVWHHHGPLFADPDSPLDPAVRSRAMQGVDLSAARYLDALATRATLQADMATRMSGFDAVLTPTTTTVAPPVADIDLATTPAHFTRAGNLLGLCGLAIPSGLNPAGMPTSLQIMGRPFAEETVLRIGAAFEQARGDLPNSPC